MRNNFSLPIDVFLLCLPIMLLSGCATNVKQSDANSLTPLPKASVNGCYIENYPDPKHSEYILPYEVGHSTLISQGNCGKFDTHQPRCTMFKGFGGGKIVCGDRRYAYDFALDIGDNILASRGGTVINLKDGFSNKTNYSNQTNFVVIKHNDDSTGIYLHLSPGLLVKKGDAVSQGDVIGLSGSSGYTGSTPHLHFDVIIPPFVKCSAKIYSGCKTTPITFRNASPQDEPLIEGSIYKALDFK